MREIEEEEKGEKWKIIENIRMKLFVSARHVCFSLFIVAVKRD